MNPLLESIVTELESGKRPKGGVSSSTGTIPSLGGEHLDKNGGFKFDKLKFIDEAFYNSLKKGRIQENDILIVKDGATTGKISFVNSDFPYETSAINEHLFILRVDPNVAVPYYVFQILKSPQGQIQILKDFRGAAIGGISRNFIKRARIPLPVIDDQKRIAHLLERVEKLKTQRKKQLEQLEQLLDSVFINMFGEPVSNTKQWKKIPLSKLLSRIDSGWSPKCESVPANDDQWGVLKLGAVTSGVFKPSENKALLPNVEPKKQHEVNVGDLLFTRKNTYELVAATTFVYETRSKLLLPDLIFRLVVEDHNEIHPIFLWKLLSFPSQRKMIQSLAAGAAGSMPNISKANLKSTLLPVPDIGLQLKFVEIVNKVEVIKNEFQNGFNELELLYGSLSQSAFKGELDLSAIQLPKESDREADSQHVENEHILESQLQKKIERATRSFEPVNKSLEIIKKITQPIEQITKPLEIVTKYVDSFNLPKVTPDFSNDKIRQKWLVKLLKEQLTALDIDCLLALSDFWEFAQNWISNFEQEDGDSFSFSIDDYEVLKDFVFNEVRNGLLLQEYEEASNSIKFKVNNK
ncbi:restriction endonuclease subunit S [Vibrio vulnificus]|nr:restriction endonuclease subunit S [Vibrio vulnificus]CAH8190830.1 Type I restriction-modification system, specificity subunit S [Vibrio aestuarianus]EHZ2903924.1 restriction endonuclease subunit S [Vibrio vulnificus]EIA1335434.1 restriction endonuclease subunit S [Vibrio vulnificus]EIA1338974.1 restriction endonuclease subunit S [Vibrio vulnificus]